MTVTADFGTFNVGSFALGAQLEAAGGGQTLQAQTRCHIYPAGAPKARATLFCERHSSLSGLGESTYRESVKK